MLIILLALCVAGIGIRIAMGENALLFSSGTGRYTVSYTVIATSDENSGYFAEGGEFFFDSGEPFGTLTGNVTLTPSEIVTKTAAGDYIVSYAEDGTVDIKGAATVTGTMTDSGFLINSNTYIAPNMTIKVASTSISVEMLITDITPVQ